MTSSGLSKGKDAMGRVGQASVCLLLIVPMLIGWPLGCSSKPQQPPSASEGRNQPLVRVRILPNQKQVTLSATQPPVARVSSAPAPRRLNIPPGPAQPLVLSANGWTLGGVTIGSGELTIEPSAEGSVSINGKPYRGTFHFVPLAGNQFDVINHLDIDSYLMSVVPREMFPNWELEAYKAQAIVARTYALYEARTSGSQHWDVFADVRSQVYGGLGSESAKSRQAVQETTGVVVAFGPPGEEKIFKAYFSACCGGISQSAWDAFGDSYSQPLSEQKVGPVCAAAPRFNWGPITIRKDQLTRRFRAWGASKARPEQSMAPVQQVRVAAVNRFGRPVRFEIIDARGNRYLWRGEEFRWAVNTEAEKGTTLNSSFVKIVDQGDSVQFLEGHGHGHGVGMCQWCAQSRALAGWAHEDIVLRSYPGAKLVRAY